MSKGQDNNKSRMGQQKANDKTMATQGWDDDGPRTRKWCANDGTMTSQGWDNWLFAQTMHCSFKCFPSCGCPKGVATQGLSKPSPPVLSPNLVGLLCNGLDDACFLFMHLAQSCPFAHALSSACLDKSGTMMNQGWDNDKPRTGQQPERGWNKAASGLSLTFYK